MSEARDLGESLGSPPKASASMASGSRFAAPFGAQNPDLDAGPENPFAPSRRLQSPEQVRLDLELAGPMSRAFAYSIDYVAILLIMLVIVLIGVSGIQQIFEWISSETLLQNLFESLTDWVVENETPEFDRFVRGIVLAIGLWMLLEVFLATVYFVVFETLFAGRTPGKYLTGLRVVTDAGLAPNGRASLLRNLLRAVDSLPAGYLIGVVSMILSPSVQRLGDLVAGTVVVRERASDATDLLPDAVVDADIEAGFRFTREELMAVGPIERRLIRQTLRRADALADRDADPIIARAIEAISTRIGREDRVHAPHERDFLIALLQASERLL